MKLCRKCNVEKPETEFHKQSEKKDGLQSRCKVCKLAENASWYAENAERHAENGRAWDLANPEKRVSYSRKYRKSNPEKAKESYQSWNAANPEKRAEIYKAYRTANPEKFAQKYRNRRAKKKSSGGSHTASDVLAIFESQRGMCANCPNKLIKSGKNRYHVDHIVPLAKGGSNDKYNLQCLCPGCNLRKSAKDPLDWAKENGKLL